MGAERGQKLLTRISPSYRGFAPLTASVALLWGLGGKPPSAHSVQIESKIHFSTASTQKKDNIYVAKESDAEIGRRADRTKRRNRFLIIGAGVVTGKVILGKMKPKSEEQFNEIMDSDMDPNLVGNPTAVKPENGMDVEDEKKISGGEEQFREIMESAEQKENRIRVAQEKIEALLLKEEKQEQNFDVFSSSTAVTEEREKTFDFTRARQQTLGNISREEIVKEEKARKEREEMEYFFMKEAEAGVRKAQAEERLNAQAKAETRLKAEKLEAQAKAQAQADAQLQAVAQAQMDAQKQAAAQVLADAQAEAERAKAQAEAKAEVEAQVREETQNQRTMSEVAFDTLYDLGMIQITPDPDAPGYDSSKDNQIAPENKEI